MRVTQRMLMDSVRMNIGSSAESLAELQDQLSSGKRIRRPSDDPQGLGRALSLKTASDRNSQYLRNTSSARGWLEATDAELDHMTGVLIRARDVAVRSASDSLGDDGRKALGEQVDGMLEEMLQGSAITHEGKYIFSGRRTTTTPFEAVRTSGRVSSVLYQGDSGELGRDIGGDVTLPVNVPGDVTVGNTQVIKQAMDTLVALGKRLRGEASGVPASSTPEQMEELTACIEGLSTLRGVVGSRMNRIDATESSLNQMQVNLATMLSRVQDADMAEVTTKLMMQENVYQAALAAGARMIQPSLLDFLR